MTHDREMESQEEEGEVINLVAGAKGMQLGKPT